MTQASIREYTEVMRGRYQRSGRNENGRILDEFIQVVGCHTSRPFGC
jgi:hypothetical protein